MSQVCGQAVPYESRARLRGDEKAPVKAIRPKFDRPPLIEQAITVVFDDLAGFSIGDFGRFWVTIENEFPECGQAAPLATAIEQLGDIPGQHEIRLVTQGEALPRCLYRHPSSGEALQIQNNRFTFNWAKFGDAPYPHSERTVQRFVELFRKFEEYLTTRGLGPIMPNQCEITNVNVVPVAEFGRTYADAPTAIILPSFAPEGGLLETEAYILNMHYLIAGPESPQGRLHVALSPVIHRDDLTPAYKLEITARSGQGSATLNHVLEFFDTARSAINAAFLAHTSREMWEKWGKRHG